MRTLSNAELGRARLVRAGVSSSAAVVRLVVAALAQVVVLPIVAHRLDPERFGVWCAISTLVAWISVMDLGINNALVNALSEADGKDDIEGPRRLVSTGFFLQLVASLVFAGGLALVARFIPWNTVLGVGNDIPPREMRSAVILALATLALTSPLGVVRAVYTGYQQAWIATYWELGTALGALAAAVLVVTRRPHLLTLTATYFAGLLLGRILSAIWLFYFARIPLRPRSGQISRFAIKRLCSVGGWYVVCQLGTLVFQQSYPWILGSTAGAAAIGQFAVNIRFLTLPMAVILAFCSSILPAYGEAQARGDWTWITRTAQLTALGAVSIGVASAAGMYLFAKPVTQMLFGHSLVVAPSLQFWLCGYLVTSAVATPFAAVLYGLERPRGPALCTLLNASFVLAAGPYFTSRFQGQGLAAVMCLGYTVTITVPVTLIALRALRKGAVQSPKARGFAGQALNTHHTYLLKESIPGA